MKQGKRRAAALLLTVSMSVSLFTGVRAAVDDKVLDRTVTDVAEYVCKTVKAPEVGSIGGEWAVLGLARSGYAVPEHYYQDYYATVEAYVKACGGNLHDKKYTEYARVILALSAIGKDARDVGGYDLTLALGDYDKTVWQGINGPVWALIALDSRNYPMPQNPEAATQATRQMYIDRILACQLSDGGWSLLGGTKTAGAGELTSDPDITGMALQALARYQDQPAVAKATQEALMCMSGQQDEDGGYSSWDTKGAESCVQIIVALCELGIPLEDTRFVKNGKTLLDGLMQFHVAGKGFAHALPAERSDQMATEQGLYAMVAIQRLRNGAESLYHMSEVAAAPGGTEDKRPGAGLEGKDPDVKAMPMTAPGVTFEDIAAHKNQPAVEALAARNIVAGKDNGRFDPDGNMTRAEFAAIVVKALGLEPKANGKFSDVPADAWYAGYVGMANSKGIVNGSGDGSFNPNGTISRQEAAIMVTNAAKLCGMDTAVESGEVRTVLAQFTDYVTTAEWARSSLTFCYREDLLDQSDITIRPGEAAKRSEIAQMIFNLLGEADLL